MFITTAVIKIPVSVKKNSTLAGISQIIYYPIDA